MDKELLQQPSDSWGRQKSNFMDITVLMNVCNIFMLTTKSSLL